MKIELLGNSGRAHAHLISNDARGLDGQRKKDVGIAEHIVIEVVVRAGAEVGEVNGPSTNRNGQADFVLLVAFASERQKTESLSKSQRKQRTGERVERRRLVVTAISAAQDPFQFGNLDSRPEARTAGGFINQTGKAGKAHACVQRKPVCDLVLVFEENHFQISSSKIALAEGITAAIIGDQVEERVVALAETVEAYLGIVASFNHCQRDLAAYIRRRPIVSCDGDVCRPAFESSTIKVIRRRHGKNHSCTDGVNPGKIAENILFALTIADTDGLRVRIVRNLKVVCARRGHKTHLIVRTHIGDERGKESAARSLIVQNVRCRRGKTVIGSIAIYAEVVSGMVIVIAEA